MYPNLRNVEVRDVKYELPYNFIGIIVYTITRSYYRNNEINYNRSALSNADLITSAMYTPVRREKRLR